MRLHERIEHHKVNLAPDDDGLVRRRLDATRIPAWRSFSSRAFLS
jgi:hypothetical protein